MGETDKNVQDPASVEGGGSTSEPETPTLTETQAKERETKAVSDALAKAGRTDKKLGQREVTLNTREEALNARQTDLDAIQKRLDEAEFNAIKGDPDLEAKYRDTRKLQADQRALAEDKRKFEQDKAQHQADIDAANATKKEIAIWEIAQKHGVDANTLKELNLETPEQIESVAKAMAAGKAPGDTETPPGGEPDSLKTKGGGELSDEQKLKARYPTMK